MHSKCIHHSPKLNIHTDSRGQGVVSLQHCGAVVVLVAENS